MDKEVRVMNKVQILTGASGIVEAYKRTLKFKQIEVVCLSSNYSVVIGDYFDKEYAQQLSGLKIKTREILPDTVGNREDAKGKDVTRCQVKFIHPEAGSESDFIVCGDRAYLISYDPKNPGAIEISDKEIVSNLRIQFENLWSRL